jgi:hypothetical protein
MDSQSQSISNHNHYHKCVSKLYSYFLACCYFFLPEQLRSDAQLMIQQTNVRSLKSVSWMNSGLTILLVHADLAVVALKVFVSTRVVNARLLVGLALVGIITPISDVLYTFLPQGRVPESEWYYESYYWLFLCIGPYIAFISFCVGAMLILIPTARNKRSYFFIVPIGFALGKIVWLWQVTNHDEYLQVPPIAFFLYSFGFVALLIGVSHYLAWRQYHRADSFPKRMDGLCQIANMNDPVQAGFVKTWQEMKAKNY